MVVDKLHFFTLPHCSILNASMYSIVISNETVSLDWTEIIETKVNLEEQFTLENFQIKFGTEKDVSTNVEWTHSDQCIKNYMIRLSYNDTTKNEIKGERRLSSPSHLGEKVQLDLHMIPGNFSSSKSIANIYLNEEHNSFTILFFQRNI